MMAKGGALTVKLPISDELADFLSDHAKVRLNPSNEPTASRAEVTKKVWAYIKANNLQDENDGRIIHPDDALEPLLGSRPINMMKMTGVLSKHFLKD